jgi:hypothetical protein
MKMANYGNKTAAPKLARIVELLLRAHGFGFARDDNSTLYSGILSDGQAYLAGLP